MKVTFVTPGMSYGGAERVMAILGNEFTKRGIEVSFIVMDDDGCLAYDLDNCINVTFMQTARFNKLGNFSRLIKKLSQLITIEKPDVIISFTNTTLTFAWIATLGANIPLIFSERNDPYNNINGFKAKAFQWIALRKSKKVVFQTEQARDYYSNAIKHKSEIILNPFNSENLPSRVAEPEKVIVSVGRLCKQKNQKLLIDAFNLIKNKYPEYRVLIYGDGPLKDTLAKQISEYGLDNRVILKGTTREILKEISKAELFVFSSDFEGLPNALIEAMIMGLPCVSTDCSPGGARALIDDGVNGLLVQRGDAEGMAKAMEKMLSDKMFSETCGNNAREIIKELDATTICDKWCEVIKKTNNVSR